MASIIEGYLGKRVDGTKSRMPARLDRWQSGSGLFLGLFMWGHMLFVSTILISNDFMYTVTKMFEGSFLFSEPHPIIVTLSVTFIFALFIFHAGLAMRKFPYKWREYKMLKTHALALKHGDTNLWMIQAFTGFVMFFLGSVHLYIVMSNADKIGPFASSDRMWSDGMWPLYLLLLFAVELHGSIGLYRLCMKWGWCNGADARASRKRLKKVKWAITIFFLTLGLLTLAAYVKIGIDHQGAYGERYHPVAMNSTAQEVRS
jgi:fumarate reductase subunit C